MHPLLQLFLITCLNCKGSSKIRFSDNGQVDYVDHVPIIACRYRPDLVWGFECNCGNDSRLAAEEVPNAHMLIANATESVVERIIKSTKIKAEKKFRMVAI